MAKYVINNEYNPNENRNMPAKILFSAIKVCNNTTYKFTICEFGNGTRKLIIERMATKRLPRGFVSSPPAPLIQYVRMLKDEFGIE
jgi:hypothetical protein